MGILEILKNLYRGIFNFNIGIVRKYAMAHSEKQAKIIMARQISKDHDIDLIKTLKWLKDHPIRWKIALEIKWEEDDE